MSDRKALRATTIIPDSLYVDREADRQLEGVIDEMGRPAYILVARQMGKTNLLLRMKRRREADGDVALYLDLSTHFDTARDLFRTIVDKLAEQLRAAVSAERIAAERAGSDVDPSAEFDRHLRLLLAEAPQERVIVILDEIDSLVGHNYSDRILSQIRSMYFARANYAVYEKLTYVLSGVAEPTDLIKDRNVSPFNIGEKIYLNDFTLAEVSLLLKNAGLKFAPEIVEAIFGWASGNPRMTWDICSALEDLQRAGETITTASVDAVIQKLYLTRFDRAPLDHIRALAETDSEVRDALVALLYSKGDTLDDRARSRLYLAGITTASANEAPRIKNRIIEFALSEAWLSQVEAGKQGLLEAASKRHQEQNHFEAISLFEQFIAAEGGQEGLSDLKLLELGVSYFSVSKLVEADQALTLALERTRSSTFRNVIRFHLGNTKLLFGNAHEALPLFEEASRHEGYFRLRAKQNVTEALALISLQDNAERILETSGAVLAELAVDEDQTPTDTAELTIAAHYQMARVYRMMKNPEMALTETRSVVAACLPFQLPGLSFILFAEELDSQERQDILRAAAGEVIDKKPDYSSSPGLTAFKADDMAILAGTALELGETEIFDQLLTVACEKHSSDRFATLIELAGSSSSSAFQPLRMRLLSHALQHEPAASPETRLDAARGWMVGAKGAARDESERFFLDLVSDPQLEAYITKDDWIVLANRLGELINSSRYEEATRILTLAKSRSSFLQAESSLLYALFLIREMNLSSAFFDEPTAKRLARQVNSILAPQNIREDELAREYPVIVSQIRDAAGAILRPVNSPPARKPPGRNEMVVVRDRATGIQFRIKYKRAEARLRAGDLELISDMPKA